MSTRYKIVEDNVLERNPELGVFLKNARESREWSIRRTVSEIKRIRPIDSKIINYIENEARPLEIPIKKPPLYKYISAYIQALNLDSKEQSCLDELLEKTKEKIYASIENAQNCKALFEICFALSFSTRYELSEHIGQYKKFFTVFDRNRPLSYDAWLKAEEFFVCRGVDQPIFEKHRQLNLERLQEVALANLELSSFERPQNIYQALRYDLSIRNLNFNDMAKLTYYDQRNFSIWETRRTPLPKSVCDKISNYFKQDSLPSYFIEYCLTEPQRSL